MKWEKGDFSLPLSLFFLSIILACASPRGARFEPLGEGDIVTDRKTIGHFIPASDPVVKIEITAIGVSSIRPAVDWPVIRALHLRVSIDNQSEKDLWCLNTRQQIVTLPGMGDSRPAYVFSTEETLPEIQVGPGDDSVFDLFYPLPEAFQEIKEIPYFQFDWTIEAQEIRLESHDIFERTFLEPEVNLIEPYEPYALGYAYGPGEAGTWWGDPFFPARTFSEPVGVPIIDY
jgi:hypothetical protein